MCLLCWIEIHFTIVVSFTNFTQRNKEKNLGSLSPRLSKQIRKQRGRRRRKTVGLMRKNNRPARAF